MADAGGGAGRQRAKDQKMAKDLADRGEYHGYRRAPVNQGTNYPKLTEVGSAAYRRLWGRR